MTPASIAATIPRLDTRINRHTFMPYRSGAASSAFSAPAVRNQAAARTCNGSYGPLLPAADQTTGLSLLALPEGFEYKSYGWAGQVQSDRTPTPAAHGGMAVCGLRGNVVALVRNNELHQDAGIPTPPAGNRGIYNPAQHGGTTSLLFDVVKGRFLSSWSSLGGTIRNCAGGKTPWGSWLSCEETSHNWGFGPQGYNHGYVFEVPAFAISDGLPIREMGRFSHSAVAVDPATGFVYETEDAPASAFYKFEPAGAWGDLKSGGRLYAMVIDHSPGFDLRGGLTEGSVWDVSWQEILDPDATSMSCFSQANQAAVIQRGEGCRYDDGKLYFISSSGGAATPRQIFCYDPHRETLTLILDSGNAETAVDGPDNIAISPRRSILMCEDGRSNPGRLIGLSSTGSTSPFAENRIALDAGDLAAIDSIYPGTRAHFIDEVGSSRDGSARRSFSSQRWAGATFYDRWLFVNVQSPGVTFAITGPWENGAL